ncbi:MAG: segregation/condensation protein A [Bacillus sp. (in: firmicutes)]
MHYKVKFDGFEGPLDLLLHLINHLEVDIYDIPVADITEQYMIYIHAMKELQLDVASEYLVMAATLLEIKSKMLLPNHNKDFDEELMIEMEEDPREELVEKLIEYRKYKEIAEDLKTLGEERSLLFTKPPSDLTEYTKELKSEKQELDVSLYDMLSALQKLLRRKKLQRPLLTKITRQEISLETRMKEIISDLKQSKKPKNFFELFSVHDKEHLVVTFLAVLELMKQNNIALEQEENFADIFVCAVEGEG